MTSLDTAIADLQALLGADARAPEWRWAVRRRLSALREALSDAGSAPVEAWLDAREAVALRRGRRLQARVGALAGGVPDRWDLDLLLVELRRLVCDLQHHGQRMHDLVYDSVALELGGSE